MNFEKRIFTLTSAIVFCLLLSSQAFAQATFAGNAQHTGVFTPPTQTLNVLKWQTDIDLAPSGVSHYGSPVVSANNTVLVPVKISTTGFRVDAFDGNTGAFKYSVATDFTMPPHNWIPPYNICIVGTRLYLPGAGGTIFRIDNIDSNTPTAPVRDVFYTSLANYNANKAAFDNSIFVNSPITADVAGNIFFTFRVVGTAPAPLNTQQSGLARISAAGTGTFVLAGNIAADGAIDRTALNAAPTLSNDETSVYVVVKASTNTLLNYMIKLNATSLALESRRVLMDPRAFTGARVLDDSTSSPMVGPDGDVYFGVFGSSGNGSRGFLLHFSGDLVTVKTPGAFGWDYTPGIVPASMVPSYTGTSSYLIFAKYNDYPSSDSAGVNKVAILDPNATQIDFHTTSNGLAVMREVLTVLGFTPDDATGFPFAVQEFCINAPAVNPATNSIYFDSEDGHIYRWNTALNSVDQAVVLTPGILQPYVPTVVGPDGTLYTLNGGNLFAVGTRPGVKATITSSSPDLRRTVVGDPVTFTATISLGPTTPTGTVTFTDTSFNGLTPVTVTLASNVPLDSNGRASVTTSTLVANATNFGNHFITANYSGDGNHQPTTVTMIQKVHRNASTTTVTSNQQFPNPGDPITFTAQTSCIPNGAQMQCGYITFYDGQTVLGQMPLDANGRASLFVPGLSIGSHTIRAEYTSDTVFAMSEGQLIQGVGPVVQFNSNAFNGTEGGQIDVLVRLGGPAASPVTVDYATSDSAGSNPCSTNNGSASSRCDYLQLRGTLTFLPGETQKTVKVPLIDDAFAEGPETFTIALSNATGASLNNPTTATLTINDNDAVNGSNPIDQTNFFVRQHYIDFLNREPDTAGLNFWSNEIESCGANAQCREVKRINVSAAFFLSIEFQETGYLAYRTYRSAFGNLSGAPVPITFSNFITGTQFLRQGVEVGVGNWQAQLEANKQSYMLTFVQHSAFTADYPNTMTATEFVTQLNNRAGNVLSQSEQSNLIAILGATPSDVNKRAQVLRAVAEDEDLKNAEFNKAFVLMQYFGYLRRNPNDLPDTNFDGYNFWLTKLNQANGNFVEAEMVKAFISSIEYRARFAQ